jgi:hypothetical protein
MILFQGRLLFLGCSLNQDRWVDYLEDVHQRWARRIGWAVLERPKKASALIARQQFLSARGITPIWYEKGAHQCVGHILRHLVTESDRVLPVTRNGWGQIADRMESLIEDSSSLLAGRETPLASLDRYAASDSNKPLIVYAPAGLGKTALLASWTAEQRRQHHAVACHFFSESRGLTSVSDADLNLLRQIDQFCGTVRRRKRGSPEADLHDELYEAVRARTGQGGERLTILIDALDECETTFDLPFPVPLPGGVRAIVSARGNKKEVEKRLKTWTSDYEALELSTLPRSIVQEWLRHAGERELTRLAGDEAFVDKLWAKTEGFPLYLKHLFAEMRHLSADGKDPRALLEETPAGFSKYVTDRLGKLLSSDALAEHRNQVVLAILAVAVGPLPEDDLAAVVTESLASGARSARTTILDLQRLPWTLTRWCSVRNDPDGTLLYGFAQPLLAQEFQVGLHGIVTEAEQFLLDRCSRWQENRSSYALRYYAAQLNQAKRWEELFALARDAAFEQAQRRFASQEADLTLRTVQLALTAAAKTGNTTAMAEFLLQHALRRERLLSESPLDAVRCGDQKLARHLSDLHDIESCTLWRLLLAWEVAATNQSAEAREILAELEQKKLARLSSWQGKYAATILGELVGVDRDRCIELQRILLADESRASLCELLIRRGDFATPRMLGHDFANALYGCAWVEASIAPELAGRGKFASALESLDQVETLHAQSRSEHPSWDAMVLNSRFVDLQMKAVGEIAAGQAVSSDLDAARQTLERLPFANRRIPCLCKVATALYVSGAPEATRAFLEEAAACFGQIQPPVALDSAWAALGEAQATCGQFEQALETVKKSQHDRTKRHMLSLIAGEHARTGDVASARKIAEEAEDIRGRLAALKAIAAGIAKAGDFATALVVADEIGSVSVRDSDRVAKASARDSALVAIASGQSAAGKFHEAVATVDRMDSSSLERQDALLQIASDQVRAGDANMARATMATSILRSPDYRLPRTTETTDDLFCEVAAAQAHIGDWNAAGASARKVANPFTRTNALRAIAREQFRSGQRELALVTVAAATEAAMQAGKHKDALVSDVARIEAESGEFEPALQTMKLVRQPYWVARGLGRIGAAAAIAGRKEQAEEILGNARSAIANVEDIREAASRDLVQCFLQARSFATAVEITLEIGTLASRVTPDKTPFVEQNAAIYNQAAALRDVVTAQVEAGLHDDARTAIARVDESLTALGKLNFMLSNHERREAIAACQAAVGDFAAAFQTAASIGSFRIHAASKARALKDIGAAQARQGLQEAARDTLRNALSAAKSAQKANDSDSEAIIGEIAVTIAEMDDLEAARDAVACISTPEQKAPSLRKIASVFAGKGEKQASVFFADAAAAAETIRDPNDRASTMTDIAVEQARSGLGEEAVRTAARILTGRASRLPEVARALVAAKQVEQVKELLVPCSYHAESALKICGLLVRLEPRHASAVADLVSRHLR